MIEFAQDIRSERQEDRAAARAFIEAVRAGDAELMENLALRLDERVDAWRLAMRGVARLNVVPPACQEQFVNIWVPRKHVPLKVGHRPIMARAARRLFPGAYQGPPLRLYRGTDRQERRCRLYGFSWTTERAVAQRFADNHSESAARLAASTTYARPTAQFIGVVLETVAPSSAILLIRQPEDWFDEGEIVVDPFALNSVQLA
jgi:hypothetical protein